MHPGMLKGGRGLPEVSIIEVLPAPAAHAAAGVGCAGPAGSDGSLAARRRRRRSRQLHGGQPLQAGSMRAVHGVRRFSALRGAAVQRWVQGAVQPQPSWHAAHALPAAAMRGERGRQQRHMRREQVGVASQAWGGGARARGIFSKTSTHSQCPNTCCLMPCRCAPGTSCLPFNASEAAFFCGDSRAYTCGVPVAPGA